MLRPSYSDLLEVLNNGEDTADAIGSRYTIVIAVAKRARQIVDGAITLAEDCKVNKPVSIAVHELYEKKIKIKQNIKQRTDEVNKISLENKEVFESDIIKNKADYFYNNNFDNDDFEDNDDTNL